MFNWKLFEIIINFKYVVIIFGILYVLYHNIGELNTVFLEGDITNPLPSVEYNISSKLLPEKYLIDWKTYDITNRMNCELKQ